MEQEKNRIIEYTADYRTDDKKTIKSSAITEKRHGSLVKEPIQTQLRVKKDDKIYNTKPEDVSQIKISELNKKQFGIYRIFFAGITMLLAVIGIVILLSSFNRTTSVMSNSSTYTKYNNFIAPVVMHDPTPFSNISEANSDFIISSSIWRCIFQNGLENYKEFDEQGLTLIPLTDIQSASTDLFGPTATINTQENIFGPFYSYNTNESNFHISTISNLGTFVPYVEETVEKTDELMLTVSYLSREDKFLSAGNDKSDTPTPVKQMIYKLKLNTDTNKYYIFEIANK